MIHLLSFLFLTSAIAGDIQGRVIYGDDNRKDLYQVQNSLFMQLADSTVAVVKASNVTIDNDKQKATLKTSPFSSVMRLCKEEPFYSQPSGAFCSGFLVGEDLMVTAGHCIRSESACQATKFVFGFNLMQENSPNTVVSADEVYSCKSIISREEVGTGADYAVVKLDRPVKNHRPLAINRSGTIAANTQLVVIGHPSGIPTKVSDGAIVRDPSPNGYFVANLDTYGGNSGSAVFNAVTGEIEGILVRGETDFVSRNGCYVSNRCTDTGCRGEDVTKASAFTKFVP